MTVLIRLLVNGEVVARISRSPIYGEGWDEIPQKSVIKDVPETIFNPRKEEFMTIETAIGAAIIIATIISLNRKS